MSKKTNSEYITEFIEYIREQGKAQNTIIAYKKDLEQMFQFIEEKFGCFYPEDLTHEYINSYFEDLKNRNVVSLKSVSRKMNTSTSFFRYLVDTGLLHSNPASKIKYPKFDTVEPRILSTDEMEKVKEIAAKDPRLLSIIEILLQSGIRIGEASRLKINHIHLNEEVPYLYVESFGSNKARTVPLNNIAIFYIKKYLEIRPKSKNQLLFVTKTGNPLLVRNLRTSIDRIFVKANIPEVKVNDLRNTFIAYNLSKGTNIFALSKIVGHKRVSTTEKYIGLLDVQSGNIVTLNEL